MICGELGKGAKTEHTPEPWALFKDDPRAIVTKEQPMLSLLSVDDEGMAIVFEESDARRIVACVNACAGIPTDDLEMSPRHGLLHLADFANELMKQRDELLAAAEAIEIDAEECLDFDECTAMLMPMDAYHKLVEAIASVKEKA